MKLYMTGQEMVTSYR